MVFFIIFPTWLLYWRNFSVVWNSGKNSWKLLLSVIKILFCDLTHNIQSLHDVKQSNIPLMSLTLIVMFKYFIYFHPVYLDFFFTRNHRKYNSVQDRIFKNTANKRVFFISLEYTVNSIQKDFLSFETEDFKAIKNRKTIAKSNISCKTCG